MAKWRQRRAKKFIRQVEHVTFSGSFAASRAQPVLYVTERCVFSLTAGGLELKEVKASARRVHDLALLYQALTAQPG
ncbi:MAG: hypothetical protein WCB70_21675 [Xanthobacteraceae bacterium]|jgi:acyl CoA:acetate/3-ketoacid CoA transferase